MQWQEGLVFIYLGSKNKNLMRIPMKYKTKLIFIPTGFLCCFASTSVFSACAQTATQTAATPAVAAVQTAATPTNLLRNARFANVADGAPANWNAFEGGFALAPAQGYEGSDAIILKRADGDKALGISQIVTLNQTRAAPITIAGWSRAQNVSGAPDNNYAVYADLIFADGTNQWGLFASFQTGTSDWKRATLEIKPEKPIKSLTFYALFREHTGQVWFSDLEVLGTAASADAPNLTTVVAQKEIAARPFINPNPPLQAAMKVVPMQQENRLVNPDWKQMDAELPTGWMKWSEGFDLRPKEGRDGKTAVFIERTAKDGERGVGQAITLNQTEAKPINFSGWSRAESVSGTPDVDYSLYADIAFQDGTKLWGSSAPFNTGTHSWQKVDFTITPEKPIKSLLFYALFRGHTGRVWFSDLSVGSALAPNGSVLFDALAVRNLASAPEKLMEIGTAYRTQNGLSLSMNNGRVSALGLDERDVKSAAPGGFLVRDVANASDYYALGEGDNAALKLNLKTKITAADDHIVVEGSVADLSGFDRAISLVFALPIDARGWTWDQTMRETARIDEDEKSNTVSFFAGANGRASLYPLANIHDARSGLAMALDPAYAAQNRLAVNGATRQFTLTYDFGLAPEKPTANFRFVIYRTDPKWGFRDALAQMNALFPQTYQARGAAKKQGLWMPFTDIRKVEGWQDFGFRFREANLSSADDESLKWDAQNGIATFRYFEPTTWWMSMPTDVPRTYEAALEQLQRTASDAKSPQYNEAQAVLSSGFRDDSGRYAVTFKDSPWSNGAVWSLNADPNLPGQSTGASLGWNAQIRDKFYKNDDLVGEYLDSLEGYVTANLNFDREQWKVAHAPLTFDTSTAQPAQHKGLLAYDYTRWQSGQLHKMNKLQFANSVPARFTFLTPWLDVMGTETDWMTGGNWTPDSDATMSLRRAMSGAKPYLLLQNTNFSKFTPNYVEKYIQRSLFYGIFPGFFSVDAANDPYWLNPKFYNRDRPLFKKYLPIVRSVAEAGWQPISLATSDNPNIWIERFGAPGGAVYLTLRNAAASAQKAQISLQTPLKSAGALKDLVSGRAVNGNGSEFAVSLASDETMVLKLN